jgi:hypothetical protein
MRWAGHVTLDDMKNTYKHLVVQPDRKIKLDPDVDGKIIVLKSRSSGL